MYNYFSDYIYKNELTAITMLQKQNIQHQINCIKTWKLNNLKVIALNNKQEISNNLSIIIDEFINPYDNDLFSMYNFQLIKSISKFIILRPNIIMSPINFNKLLQLKSFILFNKYLYDFQDQIITNIKQDIIYKDIYLCYQSQKIQITKNTLQPFYISIYLNNNKKIYKCNQPLFFQINYNKDNPKYSNQIIIKTELLDQIKINNQNIIINKQLKENNNYNIKNKVIKKININKNQIKSSIQFKEDIYNKHLQKRRQQILNKIKK